MTHDAGRLHKQHNNEDCEHNRVLPHGKTDRRNKRLKKTFELRVLMLQAQRNKENTAALEQQIEFYENEIVKYTDKINAFEQKWGR